MAERDPAEARLWAMTLVRLAGILVATGGLFAIGQAAGKMGFVAAGLLLLATGGALTLIGPKILQRRWRR